MVRLKSRYVLFELLYPPIKESEYERADGIDTEEQVILLNHYRGTPSFVTAQVLIKELRRVLQFNFGDYGSGKLNSLLQLKYFSNTTSTGIFRCHREDVDLLLATLTLCDRVGELNGIIINPIKISGTIKKIENFSINRNHKLMDTIKQNNRSYDLQKSIRELHALTNDDE